MDVLVSDLHKNRAGIAQQVANGRQPISQVGQVGMNPILPRIPERLHLLRFPRDVARVPSFTSRLVVLH